MMGGLIVIKSILLDLDGTVYKGNELIEGADLAIKNMRNQGIRVFFCTNNSSKMPASIATKLNNMGIECIEEDIVSSGLMAIRYVKENSLQNVYVSGSEEFIDGFIKMGINISDEEHAETFVIGMDTEFNYIKMTKGLRVAMRSNTIILCNEDRRFEKEDGIYPGNGGITSSIMYCSSREPDIIVGKPQVFMIEYVCDKYAISREEIMVIGDSYDSDVAMAKNFGCKYLLISGEEKKNCVSSLAKTSNWIWNLF